MCRLIIQNLKQLYQVAQYISKEKNIVSPKVVIHNDLTDSQIKEINTKLCNFVKLPHLHYLNQVVTGK